MIVQCQHLDGLLSQDFTLENQERVKVVEISPYLVIVGNPSGVFKFEILKGASVLFEENFTSADVLAKLGTVNNYAHTFHPFETDLVLEEDSYQMRITEVSGYSYSDTAYLAWAQQFENEQNSMSYEDNYEFEKTLAYRIKILRGQA